MKKNTANYILEHMPNREEMEKSTHVSTEVMKAAATIGNGVISGAVWAIACAFPWVGIPLKICTALSAVGLEWWMSDKTDKAFDNMAEAGMAAYDLTMDYLYQKSVEE